MKKVVHALSHLPFKGDSVERFEFDGWQALMAKELALRARNLEVESWLPAQVPSPHSEHRDGVLFRVFPARAWPFGYSGEMQRAAEGLGDDAILHVHGDRSMIAYNLMLTSARKFVQHHGSVGASILTPFEAVALRRAERIYCVSVQKMNYYKSIGIGPPRVQVRTMGVDFEVFRPHDKKESRRRLGIDEDARVLFHPGRFDYQKGTDVVLNAYRALRRRFEKLVLFVVGGSETDPVYSELAQETKYVRGRVPHGLMPYCYSAADVTCYFWRPPALWYGGGGAVSVFESLACNTPVVSNTLAHFSSYEGMQAAGRAPQTEEGFRESIAEVLQEPDMFRSREVARRYFSWDAVIEATLSDYGLGRIVT